MKKSSLLRTLVLSLAMLVSLPTFAAVKRVQRLLDHLCRMDAMGHTQQ